MIVTYRGEGWLSDATHRFSPNYDQRPAESDISAIVIHAISLPPDQFGGRHIGNFFCNQLEAKLDPYFESICTLRVSAHFLITREGQLIQFVSTVNRAWHAGLSSLNGETQVNDFSIGIELEGCDTLAFTHHQYARLIDLSRRLKQQYPLISPERVVGHADIAPGRKTDPGPFFDWDRFLRHI